MDVRQLGLPATVDQSKYDTNIKAWPDGMPPTNPRSQNRFATLSQKQHTANIQRNRWLFFFMAPAVAPPCKGSHHPERIQQRLGRSKLGVQKGRSRMSRSIKQK
jgi:hypothetical protein